MPITWGKLFFVAMLTLVNVNSVQASASDQYGNLHPQALSYCEDLTLNKKILLGDYQSGGYPHLMSDDLDLYDQKLCQKIINKLITSVSSLELTPDSLDFNFYPDSGSQLIALKARTFDYSFICSSTRLINITLSSADSWDVLNCIKNKEKIRTISLMDFNYRPLDLGLLKQFSNLEYLSLHRGKLTNTQMLTHLSSLNHLSLESLNITTKELAYIAKLPVLTSLRIDGFPRVEVRDFMSLTNLESLNLVFIPEQGIDFTGLEKMQTLIHLNLQGSHMTDAVYHYIAQLNQLQRLSLANNIGITTVEPLKNMTDLRRLSISNTSVSDLAPLAKHQGLFGKGYSVSYGVNFNDSKIFDLTSYYAAGGRNSDNSELLACSPTSTEEYLAGKQCNEEQRQHCEVAKYGLIYNYVNGPLCLWWYRD